MFLGVGPPGRMGMSALEDLVQVVDAQDRGPGAPALLKHSSTQRWPGKSRQQGTRAGRQ